MDKQKAIIIGAGPAGLTAAWELLNRTDITPIIYEATGVIGGISQTHNHDGNRMDIGGHRFFSKSRRVLTFWKDILPLEDASKGVTPDKMDLLFIMRNRLSRILYLRKFFAYPVSLTGETIRNLGFWRLVKIGFSYLKICLFPPRNIRSLEDFYVSRFGRELYNTFFRDYTEKVWGVPCSQISPDWGAQRVKGLSVWKTLAHAVKRIFTPKQKVDNQKVETSLIESFQYPKFGPGQLWEEVARRVVAKGGQLYQNACVTGLEAKDGRIVAVTVVENGVARREEGDYFISTMPVRELVAALSPAPPADVQEVAAGLVYRDFMTVGLLLKSLKLTDPKAADGRVKDTWIYIQEPDVKIGRLQLFHNWSPFMVKDPNQLFIGLEYFANEGDELWTMADDAFMDFAVGELVKLGVIEAADVVDRVLLRMPKAYPAYFGTYDRFPVVQSYLDSFSNLYLLGRNGQHRYNNMDHSMLTAMEMVDNLVAGRADKANIWAVNTEEEYHEEKQEKKA